MLDRRSERKHIGGRAPRRRLSTTLTAPARPERTSPSTVRNTAFCRAHPASRESPPYLIRTSAVNDSCCVRHTLLRCTWREFSFMSFGALGLVCESPSSGTRRVRLSLLVLSNRKRRASGVNRHSDKHAPRHIPEAQDAFKVLMIHWILQVARRIAFRCVLHRCGSQDIRR